ncbi:MAG: type IV pilus biogenesis/stability protein PilW [Armatimonadota bacterium]
MDLKAKGDLAGAEAKFRSALAADPNLSLAHWGLAWILLDQGKKSGDKAKIEEGIKEMKAFKAAVAAEQAVAKERLKQADEALRRLGVKTSSVTRTRPARRHVRHRRVARTAPCPCGSNLAGREGTIMTYTLVPD